MSAFSLLAEYPPSYPANSNSLIASCGYWHRPLPLLATCSASNRSPAKRCRESLTGRIDARGCIEPESRDERHCARLEDRSYRRRRTKTAACAPGLQIVSCPLERGQVAAAKARLEKAGGDKMTVDAREHGYGRMASSSVGAGLWISAWYSTCLIRSPICRSDSSAAISCNNRERSARRSNRPG